MTKPLLCRLSKTVSLLSLSSNFIGDITQDYELKKELGSGAYGIVYEGVHKQTGIMAH